MLTEIYHALSQSGQTKEFFKLRRKLYRLAKYTQQLEDRQAVKVPKDHWLKAIETWDGKIYMRLFGAPVMSRTTVAFPITGSQFKYLEKEEVIALSGFVV